MAIATGALLVLLTWALCLVAMIVIGVPIVAATRSGPLGSQDLRRGLWWGLLVVTLLSYLANLVWPLASPAVAVSMCALVLAGLLATVLLIRRRGWRAGSGISGGARILLVGLLAGVAYLAVAALGPVTNYDSGLYHLGAIRYAAEYATIPGLANLYFPLGYGNAEFPLAALLSNGPWGAEGFRLLNGLVIAGLCLDLGLRSFARRRGPGYFVLVIGVVTVLVPMVALSDYWVTSPSQDSAVFAATVAASALVADAVRGGRSWVAEAATAGAIAILLVLLRPTMIAYLLAVLVVVIVLRVRRGGQHSPRFSATSTIVIVAGAAAAVAATARDYLLSGWLQYPLSLWAFEVPWRAPDPAPERIATLGFHRDPTNIYEAADGWNWVLPWLRRLPEQWESGVLVALGLTLALLLVLARRQRTHLGWRPLLLATAPSIAMTAAWWLASPPSFRFAWGPVFTLLTVPIGWVLWCMTDQPRPSGRRRGIRAVTTGSAVLIAAVVVVSAATRLDLRSIDEPRAWNVGFSLPYTVAAVPVPDTTVGTLPSGLRIIQPVDSEQCWAAFPLCTPRIVDTVSLRSGSIAGGFEP